MTDTSPEMQVYLAEYRRRYAPLITEYEATIRCAFANDSEFDASSPVIVRSIEPKAHGGIRLMPGDVIPVGRAPAKMEGAWTPDRRLLAELLSRTLENRSRRWLPEERRYLQMPEEWPDVIRRQWPDHFGCELSIGNGWVDLLLAVHAWLLELGADFRWSQVKEKFGGARFYCDGDLGDRGYEITTIAEHSLSYCICETCGAPGRLSVRKGWYLTRCAAHLATAG